MHVEKANLMHLLNTEYVSKFTTMKVMVKYLFQNEVFNLQYPMEWTSLGSSSCDYFSHKITVNKIVKKNSLIVTLNSFLKIILAPFWEEKKIYICFPLRKIFSHMD
jgi:hypothetical protein